MTPEQERALALARARQRKAQAEASGQKAPQSSSPFIQKGINMVQGAMQSPQMRASLPAPTEPDRMQNRTDSAVLAKARQVEADIADATRKARVRPVEREAGRAGRAELDQGNIDVNPNVYLGAGSEFMLPPDAQRGLEAEREVYRANDVTSSVDAATIRGLNSVLLGIPGILNKDFRGELAAAGEDQPGASLAGDVGGFLAPSLAAWNTTRAGINALARPFIPQGSGAVARGTRYLAPRVGEVAGTAGLNAAFQAGVQEPIRAESAGEDLTLGGMADAAVRGLKDPLNLLPLGLSGINRTWNALTSGIATPSARAAQMANQFGVGPRQTSASQGIAQTTQQLGGQLQGADIRGLTNIENALRFALRDNPNIRDVNARIADGFQRIRQSLPLEDDPTLNLARLIEREFSNDAPQTRDIIRRFLSKVGQETPGGEAIVGGAANAIRGRQADVLEREAYSVFGDQPKQDAKQVLEQNLDLLGEQTYAPIVREARSAPPEAQQRATNLLNRRPETEDILFNRADREGLTVEQYVQRNPLEALHWVQSELAKQARALRGANNPDTALEGVIQNMKTVLRDNVPNYREADALYASNARAFDRLGTTRGVDAGTEGELKYDPGFGERLLGGGGSAPAAGRAEGRATARTVYDSMDEQSRRAAAISVRDIILDDLSKARAAGVDQRYEIAAKFQKLNSEGALQALVDVFGEEGQRIVRRIRQFVDANEFASAIDPMTGSNTMNKAQNLATGAQPFASGMGQRAQGASNALSESAIADSVLMLSGAPPIISAMRAPGIIGKMLQPGQRTQRNIAQTLLRRGEIGSQVPPPPGGPPPIMPIDPAAVPGANALSGQQQVTPPPPAAPGRTPRNQRFETLRFMVQRQNPGLADDQIDALAEQQYRSIYERPAPGAQMTERDFAQGWERAVREAKQSLDETAGPGNYTAADVEAEAVASYSQTFPGGRGLPEDTMALPLTVAQDGARTMSRGRTYVFEVNGKAFTGATPEEAARRAGDLSPAMGNMENRPTVRKYAIEEDGTQVPYDEAIRSQPKAPPASPESEFARLVTAEQRLNTPARELSESDLLRLAEPYARAYAAKGGQGVSDIERAAYEVVQRMGGGTKSSGLAGLRTDLGSGVAGMVSTGMFPMEEDATLEDKLARAATGFALGFGASKGGRIGARMLGRNALAGETRTAGASAPKTAQQAARYETPGSPEYEAAIAKGLDMSTPARMARAKEMGFDTDAPVYRGLTRPYDAEKAGRYQMFTSSAEDASEYAGNGMVQGGTVVPVYLRRGRNLTVNGGGNNFNSIPVEQLPADVRRHLHPSTGSAARTDQIAEAAQKAGYDSVSIKNVFDNAQGEIPLKPRPVPKDDVDALLAELEAAGFDMSAKGSMQIGPEIPRNYDPVTVDVIFDPANIRSVNAAFDPDKAASPILTAGIGGGRGPRKPKPDSPEAIAAEVRKLATQKPKEPTRLERMVEEGKGAAVPPVNTLPAETDAIAARAERMLASGKTPFEIYDQTRVVFIPYNGANIPIVSQAMGPEEVIRTFYSWLREPPIKRPEWVNDAIRKAPRKKGLLLTEQDQVPGPPASAAPEQPLPKNGIPYGAIAGGALAGALTGIGGGGAAIMGYQMLQDRNRPRNALSGQ